MPKKGLSEKDNAALAKQVSVYDLANEIKAYIGENNDILTSWPDFINDLRHFAPSELTDIAKTAPELARLISRVLSSVSDSERDLASAKVELLSVVDNLFDATKVAVTEFIKELPDTAVVNYDDEDDDEDDDDRHPSIDNDDRSWEKRLDDDAADRAERIKKEFAAWKPGDPPTELQKAIRAADQKDEVTPLKDHARSSSAGSMMAKIAQLKSDEMDLLVQLAVKEALGKADTAAVINSAKFKKTSPGTSFAGAEPLTVSKQELGKLVRRQVGDTLKKKDLRDRQAVEAYSKELNQILKELPGKRQADLEVIEDISPNNGRVDKLSLSTIYDDLKSIVNTKEIDAKVSINNPSLKSKENTMTTENKPTDAISSAVLAISEKIRAAITISLLPADTEGKINATFNYDNAKFADLLQEDVTEELVSKVYTNMNNIALGVAHGSGLAASKFVKTNPNVEHVTGKFAGPNRSHLATSYKPTSTLPFGDTLKVYKGTIATSWKGLGSPSGKEYDAVKEAIRLATEADQA